MSQDRQSNSSDRESAARGQKEYFFVVILQISPYLSLSMIIESIVDIHFGKNKDNNDLQIIYKYMTYLHIFARLSDYFYE